MAAFSAAAEDLNCAICCELFDNAVSLNCGHSFCRQCIEQHWEKRAGGGYTCPLCMKAFREKPELNKNTVLCALAERCRAGQGQAAACGSEVCCSFCPSSPDSKADRTCLTCRASYCAVHLKPHLEVAALKEHLLVAPVELTEKQCQLHGGMLAFHCKSDKGLLCSQCFALHQECEIVSIEEELREKIDDLTEFETDMDFSSAENITLDEHKMSNIKDAVAELRKNILENESLKLTVHEEPYVVENQVSPVHGMSANSETTKTPLRTTNFLQRTVKLTFDSSTANRYLRLERNNVTVTSQLHHPSDVNRFAVSQVMCLEGFSSGRHSWKVNTEKSGGWAIGIAYKPIDKAVYLGRNSRSWCLEYSNKRLSAWHSRCEIPLDHPKPCTVIVELDYIEGKLSFYSITETATLLHTFEAVFTQSVFPAFWLYGLEKQNTLILN
nr:PREDICTED: E3 ubiquitin-protein ligase RNF135 isoform X4 [Latimeria chalumnae]|eukprot:XP_005993814.1 PREDICTED: E3 ubiquitin-protein ligase RNF135 isoform X4 [Latimeria chalumnae]